MATGYVVSGRGDLDGLFKPRSSAAAANTNFASNGGVDLAQRFEPRGATAAIAATGFKSGATDLAQIFMDISAGPPIITRTFTMGYRSVDDRPNWSNPDSGYAGYPGQSAMSPGVPEWVKNSQTWRLDSIDCLPSGGLFYTTVMVSHPSGIPADSDLTWQWMALTGLFRSSAGGSVRRVLYRNTRSTYDPGGTAPNGRPHGIWYFNATTVWDIAAGNNAYTLEIG